MGEKTRFLFSKLLLHTVKVWVYFPRGVWKKLSFLVEENRKPFFFFRRELRLQSWCLRRRGHDACWGSSYPMGGRTEYQDCWINLLCHSLRPEFLTFSSSMPFIPQAFLIGFLLLATRNISVYNSHPHLCKRSQHCPWVIGRLVFCPL